LSSANTFHELLIMLSGVAGLAKATPVLVCAGEMSQAPNSDSAKASNDSAITAKEFPRKPCTSRHQRRDPCGAGWRLRKEVGVRRGKLSWRQN
jgi:hypothetical protein